MYKIIIFNTIFSIVLGFLILSTYKLVRYNKPLENKVATIFSSFVIGYLYYYLIQTIPITFNYFVIALSSIIFSYLVARLIDTRVVNKIIEILKIRRTSNPIIWTDLIDMKNTMKLEIKMSDGYKYIGYMGVTEEYNQTPMVSLYGYKVFNIQNEIIADYSKIPNRLIVLNTAKATSIEVIYGKNTIKGKEYKEFLENIKDEDYNYVFEKGE
jgi:hypothetical protein